MMMMIRILYMFFTVCAVVSLDSSFSGLPQPQHAYSNIEPRLMPHVADENAFQSNFILRPFAAFGIGFCALPLRVTHFALI